MRSLRVLCVEDRTSWLRVLQERLEESGYEVIPAESGTEGIRLFATEHIDGVLLEAELSDLDSLVVREEMHRLRPKIPVLLFAGIGRSTSKLLQFFDHYVRPGSPRSEQAMQHS